LVFQGRIQIVLNHPFEYEKQAFNAKIKPDLKFFDFISRQLARSDPRLTNVAERKLGKDDPHSEKKGNGIKYSGGKGYICFCEMKWYSDIDTKVTNDRHRNQLIRVIENALCFQNEKPGSPDQYYVTLVTPDIFKVRKIKSRFYAYKFEEYKNNKDNIFKELDKCGLDKAMHKNWEYPKDIKERIARLELNWITFEDLINDIEDDDLGKMIKDFYKKYCGYKNEKKE